MATIIRLKTDLSGIDPLNLVTNEVRANIDPFSKVIIPTFGNYFTESLIVLNKLGFPLTRNTDYACIEFDQNNSLLSGKEICSAILILNNDTELFSITYQALGGDHTFSRQQLLSAYNSLEQLNSTLSWDDIESAPNSFIPTSHLHDIEDVYGFEFILKTLVRIKKAINITPMPKYKSLLSYIERGLLLIEAKTEEYFENEIPKDVRDFLRGIDKVYFELQNISNLESATELDGQKTRERAFTLSNLVKDKHLLIESLLGVRNNVFKIFIEKKIIGLGLDRANYVSPDKYSLQQLPNGSVVSLISQQTARDESVKTDQEVYIDYLPDSHEQTIVKITNNVNNNAGVFLGFNQNDKTFYLGALPGINPNQEITWKRLQNVDQTIGLQNVVSKHIADYGNPHEVNEEDVGLELVENLPVVDKEDMMALKSVHKYLTFDALIFFMRAFLLQNGKVYKTTEPSKNQFIIDNCVVVFTPAGITCKVECDVVPVPASKQNIYICTTIYPANINESFTATNPTIISGSLTQ